MAKLGWIGLGKLGFTSALTFASRGHQVTGYDISDVPRKILEGVGPLPREAGIERLLAETPLRIVDSIDSVVAESEVVFVAVQTPHAPEYGGEVLAPESRADFEYGFLTQAVRAVAGSACEQERDITIVVVSTVLPGTFNRFLRPLMNPHVRLVYNPFFIAMGTTINDLLDPEFVLIGVDDPSDVDILFDIYRELHSRPLQVVSVETAELTKVSYNTFISLKILFANMIMEICHKTGADCDSVIDCLSYATDRVISSKYLRGGMGDGGHCHPRDLIAMSWLSQRLELSTDIMGFAVRAREAQTRWLADLIIEWSDLVNLDVVILGLSYKPESDLIGGSPSLLLLRMLESRDIDVTSYDPYIDLYYSLSGKALYFIGTKHAQFADISFAHGSVVIDPFGYIPDQSGVTVIRVGRKT